VISPLDVMDLMDEVAAFLDRQALGRAQALAAQPQLDIELATNASEALERAKFAQVAALLALTEQALSKWPADRAVHARRLAADLRHGDTEAAVTIGSIRFKRKESQ